MKHFIATLALAALAGLGTPASPGPTNPTEELRERLELAVIECPGCQRLSPGPSCPFCNEAVAPDGLAVREYPRPTSLPPRADDVAVEQQLADSRGGRRWMGGKVRSG